MQGIVLYSPMWLQAMNMAIVSAAMSCVLLKQCYGDETFATKTMLQ